MIILGFHNNTIEIYEKTMCCLEFWPQYPIANIEYWKFHALEFSLHCLLKVHMYNWYIHVYIIHATIFCQFSYILSVSENWAAAWQNQQYDLCAQRRLRPACASTQSDQSSLCPQWIAKDPRCGQRRLIRLSRQVILLVLSCFGSNVICVESYTFILLVSVIGTRSMIASRYG